MDNNLKQCPLCLRPLDFHRELWYKCKHCNQLYSKLLAPITPMEAIGIATDNFIKELGKEYGFTKVIEKFIEYFGG